MTSYVYIEARTRRNDMSKHKKLSKVLPIAKYL